MRAKQIRVLFFAPSLGVGGAEMQVLRVANELDHDEFRCRVAVARSGGSYEPRLDPAVEFATVGPGVRSSLGSVFGAVPRLAREIARFRAEVVVSLQEHTTVALLAAAALSGRSPKRLIGIQNNLDAVRSAAPVYARRVLFPLYERSFAAADHVVALSRGVAEQISSLVPAVRGKLSVVYNAGFDDALERLAAEPLAEVVPDRPLIVACGRLTRQKDFSTLLAALSRLPEPSGPALWILGEGEERAALECSIVELGLGDRVRLLGFRDNPYPFMARADLFVLSSRWEGFANVVAEALSCGTRVVSTDCPFGPGEILEGGRFGELVPVGDAAALARAIATSLARTPSAMERAELKARGQAFGARESARGYAALIRGLATRAPLGARFFRW